MEGRRDGAQEEQITADRCFIYYDMSTCDEDSRSRAQMSSVTPVISCGTHRPRESRSTQRRVGVSGGGANEEWEESADEVRKKKLR